MRLLNTRSGEFEEFSEGCVPEYGILSHRWVPDDSQEVSFREYGTHMKKNTSGWEKIQRLLKIAGAHNLSWAWIDTCCIDKTSSAELSEAINSMFSWYHKAQECYVYLDDVSDERTWRTSRWWGRGWTLQELIAPKNVEFYDQNWTLIGNKEQWANEIQELTRIPVNVLKAQSPMTNWTVAQRLSWAAHRQTTRTEDRAYSLLGLFKIYMSPIYGEGHRAFRRLQLEILQKYPDDSVLAWTSTDDPVQRHVLAESPDDFQHCPQLQPVSLRKPGPEPDPPTFSPPRITNWGIELRANAHRLLPPDGCTRINIDGQSYCFLWALLMTTAWEGKFQELPCILILVPSGPARYGYRRLKCVHYTDEDECARLEDEYTIEDLENNVTFYLQFDDDID